MRGIWLGLTQIWHLAYPYFVTRDRREIRIWPLPRFQVRESWLAIVLALTVIGIEFGQVAINVRLSYFNRDWFNSIQNKEEAVFWSLLLTVFCFWAAIYIASAIIQYVLQARFLIGWRRWLTNRYSRRWLSDHTHYRMQLAGLSADNPDQRIQEDIERFTERTVQLVLAMLSAASNLISFSVILWGISAQFTVPGTDLKVPGFLVWGALLYSALATWLTHLIGKPLIRLNFEQQRYEADFRFSLARLREYSEQVALLDGERAERDRLDGRFARVLNNYMAIVSRRKKLLTFTASYTQANAVIPYILIAPYYFAGQIPLGGLTQTAQAFARVETTMSFFISFYTTLADYKAVVNRLIGFETSIRQANAARPSTTSIASTNGPAEGGFAIEDLTLSLPDGREIVEVERLDLRPGETVLLTGPSGSGKSTLFRALAGIWPFGHGRIRRPQGATMLLLPQRPYFPVGTLRGALTYPAVEGSYGDAEIAAALEAARLPALVDRLDEEALWTQTLSLGEQQRVAVARALLSRPDWLFLDEATAALDEPSEAAIYRVVAERLPGTTVVSIGHRTSLLAFHERRVALVRTAEGLHRPAETEALDAAQ